MKILYINTIDTKGGAAKIAHTLKCVLKDRGHDTSMLVKHKYSNDTDVHIAEWPNLLTRVIKSVTGKNVGSYLANKIRPLLANDIEFFKSDRILKTKEFREADIVHCHNLHGNYFNLDTLRKMAEIKPVVWTLHDTWALTAHCARIYSEKLKNGFYQCENLTEYQSLMWNNTKHLENTKRRTYRALKNITLVAPSKWMLEKIKTSVLADKPSQVIYNSVDTNIFTPMNKSDARRKLGLPAEKKIILYISAIGQDTGKGWGHISYARQQYLHNDSVLFVTIGQKEPADQKARQNIIYVEYQEDNKTLALYFAAADVFLYPSLAESFGLVAAEALATGIPTVVFRAGGLPEIIEHKKNGYVAELANSADLVRGVEYVLNLSKSEKLEMTLFSRKRAVQLFSTDIMVNNYLRAYESALNKNRK